MELFRRFEHVKAAFRTVDLNHTAEVAAELFTNIGGGETGVLNSSPSKSGLIFSEIDGIGATVPLIIRLWKVDKRLLAVSALLLIFSVIPAGSVQQENPQEPRATLSECYAKVREWEEWADRNLQNVPQPPFGPGQQASILEPRPEKFAIDTRRIREEESKSQWMWFLGAMGLGLGLIVAITISKAIKRSWPLIRRTFPPSPAKKQLFVLIAGATWISVATLLAISLNSDLFAHPINLLATVGVYSLPAILFGGVCFWWIGKHQLGQKVQ